jgi:hypothetical protein
MKRDIERLLRDTGHSSMREKGERATVFFLLPRNPQQQKIKYPHGRYGAEREREREGSESYSICFAASEFPAAKNKILSESGMAQREKGEKRNSYRYMYCTVQKIKYYQGFLLSSARKILK